MGRQSISISIELPWLKTTIVVQRNGGGKIVAFVKHLSVRVPWHDRGWDGHVCNDPLGNNACLALKLISENRNDQLEPDIAGESFEGLSFDQVPPCIRTSSAFLSKTSHSMQSVMAYSTWSKPHKHMKPKTLHIPAYGAQVIPYRWTLKKSGFELAQELELGARLEFEPSEPDFLKRTSWIQQHQNQRVLLESFAAPLVTDKSLVLFYTPRTPLCDDQRRVLVGVAILAKKHDLTEYDYEGGAAKGRLQAMVWERSIQHSLRPVQNGEGFVGGFVLPYQQLLQLCETDPSLNPAEYVAFTPDESRLQFSYGSEQVSHGAAASALLSARNAFERIGSIINGPWGRYISWIDALWRLQGPAPGLGVVLSSLHAGFNGTLFSMALSQAIKENEDPWPVVDAIVSGTRRPPNGAPKVTDTFAARWKKLKSDSVRFNFLKLLARFELTKDQALRAFTKHQPASVLDNPYLLYQEDRTNFGPIAFATIDRGLYPGAEITNAHPLPAGVNEKIHEPDNWRRLKGACVHILETVASEEGHTLLDASRVGEHSSDLSLTRPIPLDADLLDIFRDDFSPDISISRDEKNPIAQLQRYVEYRKQIEKSLIERLAVQNDGVGASWDQLLKTKFGPIHDKDEKEARTEKKAALKCLASNHFAVLTGSAGTGKTAVLEILLKRPEIVGARICLLAPTGKARVRLGEETGHPRDAQTIAQFLRPLKRYDVDTGRYFPNKDGPKANLSTCIIDESSMLTEDMLSAIVDAMHSSSRLVLVGDPYQLPPIGAGCPFVDIVDYLKEHHPAAIAELTVPRRQNDQAAGIAARERSDVQLAALFSGRSLPPGEDEIAALAVAGLDDNFIKTRRWEKPSHLPTLIQKVLAAEFGDSDDRQRELEISLGAVENEKGYLNFERGCSNATTNWQILCVNKSQPGGSVNLNRHVKETYRCDRLAAVVSSNRISRHKEAFRYIKPRGPEQLTYGDKVICVRNHWRDAYVYSSAQTIEDEYLANGDIGVINGQVTYSKSNPIFTNVEFSGRTEQSFGFRASDFREEGQPFLELAYALTVHKAQGSQFGTVILVLPAHSRLISREMIYTGLTRQERRIWILHQGPFENFLSYRHPSFSAISARLTNLLSTARTTPVSLPTVLPTGDPPSNTRGFREDRLLHRTIRGESVSSKNELAIANILFGLEKEGHLTYSVEPKLPFADGWGRLADFEIFAAGKSWYWEHCGLLHDEHYRRRWNTKRELYAKNGFSVYGPENLSGRLIVTEDGPEQGLDSRMLESLARRLFVN